MMRGERAPPPPGAERAKNPKCKRAGKGGNHSHQKSRKYDQKLKIAALPPTLTTPPTPSPPRAPCHLSCPQGEKTWEKEGKLMYQKMVVGGWEGCCLCCFFEKAALLGIHSHVSLRTQNPCCTRKVKRCGREKRKSEGATGSFRE